MRVAAGWMQTRPRVGIDVFVRPAAVAPPREGGHVALMEACLVVLRGGAVDRAVRARAVVAMPLR
jgi:hypothetical protein